MRPLAATLPLRLTPDTFPSDATPSIVNYDALFSSAHASVWNPSVWTQKMYAIWPCQRSVGFPWRLAICQVPQPAASDGIQATSERLSAPCCNKEIESAATLTRTALGENQVVLFTAWKIYTRAVSLKRICFRCIYETPPTPSFAAGQLLFNYLYLYSFCSSSVHGASDSDIPHNWGSAFHVSKDRTFVFTPQFKFSFIGFRTVCK